MSTDKSKAARIADELEYKWQRGIDPWASELSEAAAELRRLSESEAALLEALELATQYLTEWQGELPEYVGDKERVTVPTFRTLITSTKEARNA